MDGILLLDKPSGWTSHDVVAKVRHQATQQAGKRIKIGHTGTLDPAATGLLVLVLGSYTKRAGDFSKLDKTYEVELTLGVTSTTGDSEGKTTAVSRKKPSEEEIQTVLELFVGQIQQTPPNYSAIKVDGQRAYKLARAGKEVKLEPRTIKIHSITDVKYEYPHLKFTTAVSSGTYIRSLAEDIGQKLGTGAYLSALRRTQVGDLDIKEASGLDKIELNNLKH